MCLLAMSDHPNQNDNNADDKQAKILWDLHCVRLEAVRDDFKLMAKFLARTAHRSGYAVNDASVEVESVGGAFDVHIKLRVVRR